MIAFENLRKAYGTTVAVDGLTFTAPDGVVTGLLGPNGAGKTTALRALTGLVKPDAGTAAVDGHDVRRGLQEARARLGVLPEAAGLYDRLTVAEHLAYSGELQGLPRREVGRRVAALLEQLGLTPLAGRLAGALSLGERRRVALARALVHDPPNVVLDEPTNGLDVLNAREVRREVRRLAASGRAVVLSSHVMPEVSAVCDRIVILSRGRVVAAGTPDEILARAGAAQLEDAFVALIGSEEGLK
ncbi:MAG TPA: ABC transporter ATP-binding protein [Vicinamibacterales bacterium]|nr:ABC transporter ATP-binding protein [Vicinamibacterales bacterium]